MTGTPLEKARILVVDDNPAVLKLLGTLFEEEGMSVTLAKSAAEAKRALDAAKWDFDLVLSDISMPGESGFDLLGWIKREGSPNQELPVLLTTAQLPEAENRVKGLAMGAVDYVVRPIELSELVLRSKHAIEHFQRVRSLERSLQSSENLAMVGRLLAASHHEIKNLASIVGLASDQTIKRLAPTADAGGSEALTALKQAVTLLTDVSKSVSSLLEPAAESVRPTDLHAMATAVVGMMRPRVGDFRLEVSPRSGNPWALTHEMRLKQVLINLILNAHDAISMLEGEGDATGGGFIQVIVDDSDDTCRVTVRDNGIGFSAPALRSEFKPFTTTKKLRGGQGLGLWLCATMVRNMGGQLTLSSRGVGEGAEATVTLPLTTMRDDDLDVQKYLDELDDQ